MFGDELQERMNRVHEGMAVFDARGKKIGDVEYMHFGDPEAQTTQGNVPQPGLVGQIYDLVTGELPEPDVAEPFRSDLMRKGYLKIDGPGIRDIDRYVASDEIANVTGDRVVLSVRKDDLPVEI